MSKPEIDALLHHSGWVRAMARSLTRDPGLAEDAIQETWLSVLRRGPHDDRSPRGWLATLVRRHLRQSRRGAERRVRREHDSARDLALPSTAELVERAESGRTLAQAVLELREPFRTTVLLRYFEELAPDEIAARLGVPVSTVYSRLSRAHAMLRATLEEEQRGRERRGWASALFALRLRGPLERLWRVLVTSGARALLAPAAALLVLALCLRAFAAEEARAARRPAIAPPAQTTTRDDALAELSRASAAREAVPTTAAENDAVSRTRAGLVLDPSGEPVPGVALALVASEADGAPALQCAVSAADGTFSFAAPAASAVLVARDPAWETVLQSLVEPERATASVVVVAKRVAVAGRVVGPGGEPLAGASLALFVQPTLPVAFERALDACRPKIPALRADASGAFAFEGLPSLPEAQLSVRRPGFLPALVPVPAESDADFEIVLARPSADVPTVHGIVLDAHGAPVADADVAAFPATARTGADGRFELALWPAPVRSRIAAAKHGVGATVLDVERGADGATAWPAEVVLRLAEAGGELRGHVVDARGLPLPRALIWVEDPTFVCASPRGALAAESVLAEAAPRVWRTVESDSAGAFTLAGLLEREYGLCALDPRTLALHSVRVHPGASVEIALDGSVEPLAGRVVDSRGRALAGVAVELVREAFRTSGTAHAIEVEGPSCRTDAEGRFALPSAALGGTRIRLTSDAILPAAFDVGTLERRSALRLVVSLRTHLRVELVDEDSADSFEVRGADGRPRELVQLREGCSHPHLRPTLTRGRSLVLTVPDDARELVLYRQGEELERFPVAIDPGRLNVVRR